MANPQGVLIHIRGIVQGVGFRPFVYNLARQLALTGWVRNTSAGVEIRVDGSPEVISSFIHKLTAEAPTLAQIDELTSESRPADGFTGFEIRHSEAIPDAFQSISPDICICSDCLQELFDPADRRYRYPFINCTNCGPRFTIIEDIPYDRPNTTMSGFPMCPECRQEYENPLDRRFHAQPVACPVCGPQVWLEVAGADRQWHKDDAILKTQELLAQGKIVAIKGIGGFHLACDALNAAAVGTLRQRKLRVDKPFAVMLPDGDIASGYCRVNEEERELLESRSRPIVILERSPQCGISAEVAPGQQTVGVMLPYTPLHYLLFAQNPTHPITALVMTSGNLSEEPIVIENQEARQRLGELVDAFLFHDRPIRTRCDDSVVRVFSSVYPFRRSRGYAPFPVKLPASAPTLLAVGAELKNTFCLTQQDRAFLSHHIGDMENYETYRSFEDGIAHFEKLFRARPTALACDLHPDYLSTRYAAERGQRAGLPVLGVQHHFAHIAACMAENDLQGDSPVIGVALDGTGYGPDGAIWGGEFLLADYHGYRRLAHLEYYPLPGGDRAVRKPARTGLAYLWQANLPWQPGIPCYDCFNEEERATLRHQLEESINTPITSSMGRLFDAISALVGVRQQINYEAQAAIELEALVAQAETGSYSFDLHQTTSGEPWIIRPAEVIRSAMQDFMAGLPTPVIAARFHNGVARMILDTCLLLRDQSQINRIALSGGVWQNLTLLTAVHRLLSQADFQVYVHRRVPANDGGISLGQAVVLSQSRLLNSSS